MTGNGHDLPQKSYQYQNSHPSLLQKNQETGVSEGNNFIDSQDLREMGRDTFSPSISLTLDWVSPASRQALKDRFPGHCGTGSNPRAWEPDADLPWLQGEFKDSLG